MEEKKKGAWRRDGKERVKGGGRGEKGRKGDGRRREREGEKGREKWEEGVPSERGIQRGKGIWMKIEGNGRGKHEEERGEKEGKSRGEREGRRWVMKGRWNRREVGDRKRIRE